MEKCRNNKIPHSIKLHVCVSAVSSGGDSAFSYFQSGRVRVRACQSKSKNINKSALTERPVILANVHVSETVDHVRA